MSKAPSVVTMAMIWDKLANIEKEMRRKLNRIEERELKGNIEEVSLNKARKMLHVSERVLFAAIEAGELKAMKTTSSKGSRYRFRLCDIYDFQQLRAEQVSQDNKERTALLALDEDEGEIGAFDAKEYVTQFHKGKITA